MKRIPIYKRVVLEISGEMLKGASNNATNCPIDFEVLDDLAKELIAVRNHGVELGVVVGGGNIWRGASNHEIEPATSHQIGMLATVMNALAFRALLEKHGVNSYIASTLGITSVVEACNHHQVITRLARNEIVIFAGGTGQPFFTTDTGAALWALKIKANVILKATKVDGVYSADPFIDPNAQKYSQISYREAIQKELRVMDLTAFSLCKEHQIPIIVFKLTPPGNIKRAIFGEDIGTIVCDGEQRTENGERKTENGEWRTESGELISAPFCGMGGRACGRTRLAHFLTSALRLPTSDFRFPIIERRNNMPKQILRGAEERIEKAVEAAMNDFAAIRTGRASPSLLDNIQIDYYGTKSPIKQVATITTPEPRLIVIQPWDKTIMKEIEKAITQSNLGLNPNSDKNVIRLTIPELTEERRKSLVKHVRQLAEDGRNVIRNVRRDANDALKKLEKAGKISEDSRYMNQERVQELTDEYIGEIDELLEIKEGELMEV